MDRRITALPCWRGLIRAEPLSGGLSNEIWKVTDAAGDHVLRFGNDYPFHHVSRLREAMSARAAHAAGFAPEVEYTAPGVMVTRFVASKTWSAAEVRANPERIGALLRDFHTKLPPLIEGAAFLFWPFHVNREYLREVPGLPDLAQWQAVNTALESGQPPLPLVFAHNDLLPANFLEGEDGRLWLIDYEYAGFNTCLFDLAGAASNAGMSAEESGALLSAYLGHTPDPTFLRAFDGMQVASLLREYLWALVSDRYLRAPDVDYSAYAAQNRESLLASLDQYQTIHGKLP